MCSHYESITDADRLADLLDVAMPDDKGVADVWPGYMAILVRNRLKDADPSAPAREAIKARFGLLPHWAKDDSRSRHTFNARSETVADLASYRDPWKKGQRCIVPLEGFYEPDWRSGIAIPTRFSAVDGKPLGIAGIWECNTRVGPEPLYSFAMLTLNADGHALLGEMHRPGDEKRMPAILPPDAYDTWLSGTADQARALIVQYPAEKLQSEQIKPGTRRPGRTKPPPDELF